MSKAFRNVSIVFALTFLVVAALPAVADETATGDFQGPKLLPGCKAEFKLSTQARHAVGDSLLVFQAIVLKDGTIGYTELLNNDKPYPGVEQAAKDSFHQWKYQPGKLGGVPVDSGVTISVIFRGMSAATMTRPAEMWSFRELSPKGLPGSILDTAIFNGRRGGRYQSSSSEFPGGDVRHGTGCDFKAGPRCAYLIPGGPSYQVDLPLADSGVTPGSGK